MHDLEQLKTIDERIAEAERLLIYLNEHRREIINRNNLNKVKDAEKTQTGSDRI